MLRGRKSVQRGGGNLSVPAWRYQLSGYPLGVLICEVRWIEHFQLVVLPPASSKQSITAVDAASLTAAVAAAVAAATASTPSLDAALVAAVAPA